MRKVIMALFTMLLIGVALAWLGTRSGQITGSSGKSRLVVWCAAGVLEHAALEFTEATATPVRFQFGSSCQLLNDLVANAPADQVVAGDVSSISLACKHGLFLESPPVAQQPPVTAVTNADPHAVHSLTDLTGLRYSMPNSETASLGRTLEKGLGADWAPLMAGAALTKPTLTDMATELQAGFLGQHTGHLI